MYHFKSIYNTTNFEVKRQICLENIRQVERILNSEKGADIRTSKFWELKKLLNRFKSQLREVENHLRAKNDDQFEMPFFG